MITSAAVNQWFVAIVVVGFLLAGIPTSFDGATRIARWCVLCLAIVVGVYCWRERRRALPNGPFQVLGAAVVGAAFGSSSVSVNAGLTLLKATGLGALFLYTWIGLRVAATERAASLLRGMSRFCEVLVSVSAVCYAALGHPLFGNPNALGAVMGVFASPILLGTMLASARGWERCRTGLALLLCWILLCHSQSRAGLLAACVSTALVLSLACRLKPIVFGAAFIVWTLSLFALVLPQHSSTLATVVTDENS